MRFCFISSGHVTVRSGITCIAGDSLPLNQQEFLYEDLKATSNLLTYTVQVPDCGFQTFFSKDLRIFMEMAGSWYKTVNIPG